LQFAERFEPRFEEEPRQQPVAGHRPQDYSQEPAFLGLQPVTEEAHDDLGLDLERELELSIGDGLAADAVAGPEPSVEETRAEPDFSAWAETGDAGAAAFRVEPACAGEEPHFVAEMPFETRDDLAQAVAEAETQWQSGAPEPVFETVPAYQV